MLSSYGCAEEVYQEYRERMDSIQARYQCPCAHTVPTRRTLDNGVTAVWLQCLDCGRGIRALRKSDYDLESLPWFDSEKRDGYRAQATAERERESQWLDRRLEEIRHDEAADAEANDQAWWDAYRTYLRSRQWHALRQRVLKRDGKLCQACLSREATQVHHLTYRLYDKLGYSAAFECVAICHHCHGKIHPQMATTQHDLTGYSPYLNGTSNGHR